MKKIYYKNHVINIDTYCDSLDNPRDWCNLGTMLCSHTKYDLGDKQGNLSDIWIKHATPEEKEPIVKAYLKNFKDGRYFTKLDAYREFITEYDKDFEQYFDEQCEDCDLLEYATSYLPENVIGLPLYLYDHSGITINTCSFSCPWDSGQVGVIYVTKETLKKEGLENKTEKEVKEYLKNEVNSYDSYLRGEIYHFSIMKDDEEIDSCGGYFSFEDAETEAKNIIDSF